ncbi:hypothetical protein AOQ84DRAFT_126384 [Glonium stellatum]|uniref:RBR-type E3 ubiquitin transferase n=1 Tax=Glonium stellatum TaxID=574774 RepID=A0A8E2FAX2_9PEZI|nr:hypothetical protein AOQ84DRAFT_126384 [Glonium stellatum]
MTLGMNAEAYLDNALRLQNQRQYTNYIEASSPSTSFESQETAQKSFSTQSSTAVRPQHSTQKLRSWAAKYHVDSKATGSLSRGKELVREVSSSIQDAQSENHGLFQEVSKLHRKLDMTIGSPLWPVTLRMILMTRITEATFGPLALDSGQSPPLSEMGYLCPIPSSALDVTLNSVQANRFGIFLQRGHKQSNIYRGLRVYPCTKCYKPRFRFITANCHPLFSKLNEYPQINGIPYGDICSPCGLKALSRGIWWGWWGNLGNFTWLKHDWDETCFNFWINSEKRLEDILDSLGYGDTNHVNDYVKNFKLAVMYRQALRNLHPRPNQRELDAAAKLHTHLIKRGYMRSFFEPSYGVYNKFEPGPVVLGSMDNGLKIPIFSRLFRRRYKPKECVVCCEEKYEISYGKPDQWGKDCAGYSGLWMWSILEYPTNSIQKCDHDFDVCRACIAQHISTSLGNVDIDRIMCPQCDKAFSYDEIRSLAEPETFQRYDKILLQRALSSEPNFRWCLSETCESGQVYDNFIAMVKCAECGFRMCFRHQQPWHTNITCTDFEDLRLHGDPNYVETQKLISKTTKGCPECGVRITKGKGCFHMTCRSCKHEFCWECLADWDSVQNNPQRHNDGCYFRSSTVYPTAISGENLQAALQRRYE